MALPRPRPPLRPQGLRRRLQTNHPRTALVSHPAAPDNHHLHGHLRQHRPAPHGRTAAVPLLHVRHRHLDLFRGLSHQDLQHFRQQRPALRQGLLPQAGGAGLDPDLQPDHFRHPVCILPRLHGILRPYRCGLTPQLVDPHLTSPHLHDGRPRPRIWHHHLLPHHQIPRPALPGAIRCPAPDVCYPGHLPGLLHPRPFPAPHSGQSHDPHSRNI